MAENNTNLFLEILESFDAVPLIIAFCVSMGVGLVLGALVYVLLTWMSRRRAGSASITRRPPRPSRTSSRNRPGFNRNSSYDRRSNNSLVSAAFSFHRQTSSPDHFDPLGHKSSFRASTFHPLLQCSQIAREAEEGSQTTLPRTPTLTSTSDPGVEVRGHTAAQAAATPPRPESFWGGNGVRGLQATQTPPPAYESIIRAYQETRT
ncbi:myc target protein 1 homolog [Limanda limanda]|uniref:myc target protein 1 homolog n=1 Tax=Limanda limanda TaxID=27771 RepID=UPI0029C69C24|nr:myc target protein 1 homolog [Limanda limanda]